ncbi:hypothetical protein KSX_09430 [Ktedonospora formicarum]|uniref:Protein kinase domain-containing protein n=1 Tax=Ktedonospora formicarum TaxID=2778364 RepID=A0A8J3HXB8_9CHLR|nr:hypothetical protein KSX_09430 [Ktedonospora formicarum]
MRFCNWCGTTLNGGTATGALSAQTTLADDRYMILDTLGQGGMGAVYKALDLQFNKRIVAIKEMRQDGLVGQDLQEAIHGFTQEAEMLVHLKHPGLPHIYAQFEDNGRRYLVMEFIQGETLEHRLQVLSQQGKQLPVAQALTIANQLCIVLDYLHSQHPPIIFRDLKPANIMLDAQDRVSLIDFGIARFFKPGQVKDTVALGSPGYAPPEQYRKSTSPRSDIYSLGATLHQMLTGEDPSHAPFYFKSFSIQMPRLEQFILQMVALDEQQRPASMQAVLKVLNAPTAQSKDPSSAKQVKPATPMTTRQGPLRVMILLARHKEDQALGENIVNQLQSLIVGFPEVEIEIALDGDATTEQVNQTQLVILLVSDAFLSTPACMTQAERFLDRCDTQGLQALVIRLRPCTLSGSRFSQLPILPEEDSIKHLSLYAQEQRIVEAAKAIRTRIALLHLPKRPNGRMNLLQWLLYQLYGDGRAVCRYLAIGDYTLQHIQPVGLAGVLLHLYHKSKERPIAEYVIGPLHCRDLSLLLNVLSPSDPDPEEIEGVASRNQPRRQRAIKGAPTR